MNFIKTLIPRSTSCYNAVVNNHVISDLTQYETSEELEEVRSILGLTNSAYDFGLHTALVCINAYPELLKEIKQENLIEFVATYKKPELIVNGAKILPVFNKFSVEFRPHRVIKDSTLVFSYESPTKIKLSLDGEVWFADYELNRNLLIVQFPEELNSLAFSLEIQGNWVLGSQASVTLVPNSYPFVDTVNKLKTSLAFMSIANSVGLHDTFISFPELTYKIAIATLAVSRKHLQLNNG
jgi:hypothetical protein